MQNGGAGLLIFLLPVLLIVWMVFTQRKRQKVVQSLQDSLAVGDTVCTTSGMFGTITALEAGEVTLEVSPGVSVRFDRRAIGTKAQGLQTNQTPASEQAE